MHLFGDKERFAISHTPFERETPDSLLAYCHFIFSGHLIGHSEETCLLGTWTGQVKSWRNHVQLYREQLSNQLFQNLSDREIFEMIVKSNQIPEEYDPAFDYLLAQPTNDLWSKHYVRLDETIDGFSIAIIESGSKLKLIWNRWRKPNPEDNIGHFFSVNVEHDLFFQTIDNCLNFLAQRYSVLNPDNH